MAVTTKTRVVYFSSAANRHFMTKQAAFRAEATALIKRKYPTEPFEDDTGAGWHWTSDDRLVRLHSRLIKLVRRAEVANRMRSGS